MDLAGKTALVTGGNDGLGLEIVKHLIDKKSKAILVGKDSLKVADAVRELKSDLVTPVVCDIRNEKQVAEEIGKLEGVDILINCAGVIAYQPLESHDTSNIREIVETNLLGTIFVTRALLNKMKQKNSGIILNVSSTSGLPTGGHANESVYMASKYGVAGFTDGLKKEVAAEKKKIKVIGFYPGGMDTQLFAKSGVQKDTTKFMDPGEIAKIVIFILERPDTISIDHIVVNRNKSAN